MLLCNLAVLLAERGLKITKVSNDTKISRTTLTALTQNASQGIQFDTLNALCSYLNVTPNDFFSFFPFDVDIYLSEVPDSKVDYECIFSFKEKNTISRATVGLFYIVYVAENPGDPLSREQVDSKSQIVQLTIGIYFLSDLDKDPNRYHLASKDKVIKHLSKLPIIFKRLIDDKICDKVVQTLGITITDETIVDVSWPDELIMY